VRHERAPFNHPELFVPHGHPGDHTRITIAHPLDASLGDEEMIVIPAVGAAGPAQPIEPFESGLAP
jgi:hypothetical protein